MILESKKQTDNLSLLENEDCSSLPKDLLLMSGDMEAQRPNATHRRHSMIELFARMKRKGVLVDFDETRRARSIARRRSTVL
mmetsp:Transcript_17857/g.30799  ORF Transcript_17857/g.30799 Transcript_17857/m.30799 type:complete len:82 (+) Transcript_17857:662-907(+)